MYKLKKGFTLVELLVVISIIAILLAVLMPALNKAKMNAKMIICAIRQKSILTAVVCYTSEYGGKLPPSIQGKCAPIDPTKATFWTWPVRLKYFYTTDRALNGGSVIHILGKYMKDPVNWNCPLSNDNVNWQKKYFAEMENERVNMLDCSYMLYWNYLGFYKSYNPGDGVTQFGFNPVMGKDTLMITDLFLPTDTWNTKNERSALDYISSHPFKGSSLYQLLNQTDLSDASGKTAVKVFMGDTRNAIPQVKLNAGYLDGHVEKYDTKSGISTDIAGNQTRYVLSAKWK